MDKQLALILEVTPTDKTDEIKDIFNKKGMVETVIYLAEKVWDDDTRKLAEAKTKSADTENKYYKVLMDVYGMKTYFDQVRDHKCFIILAYERLKDFVPNMTYDQAEAHDMSKFDLSQSIGYTARWVHGIDPEHECWQRALHNHYHREPHHPQFYKCDEQMERKYLEESLIDMVACQWERQLKRKLEVKNSQLVDFDNKFLTRYVDADFNDIAILIQQIKSSD